MNIPTKKLKNGFEMPEYGLGTWLMGGAMQKDANNDDAGNIQALKKGIEMGLTHIDTAEIYAEGHTEELVGQAIQGYDRSKLFIVSKVFKTHLKHDQVIQAAEESLKRLKTNYLDLYLIHAPSSENVPLKETMTAMNELVEKGLVKYIGVSNFSPEQMKEAQSYSKNKIVANQIHYSLMNKDEQTLQAVEYCQQNDMMVMAYRPINRGLILEAKSSLLDELCKKYKKTRSQIAINWLISQKNVVTMSTMRNEEHLKENVGALGWYMEQEDVENLTGEQF